MPRAPGRGARCGRRRPRVEPQDGSCRGDHRWRVCASACWRCGSTGSASRHPRRSGRCCGSVVRPARRRALIGRGADRQCSGARGATVSRSRRARRYRLRGRVTTTRRSRSISPAVEKNPDDAESLSNLGQVLVRMNRTPEVDSVFRAGRRASCRAGWAYQFNLARALGLLGRMDEVDCRLPSGPAAVPGGLRDDLQPGDGPAQKRGRAAAVEQYQKAIALQPEDASFRKALGISYEQLKQMPQAAAAYEEYLRLSPSAADADRVRARIARCYRDNARPKRWRRRGRNQRAGSHRPGDRLLNPARRSVKLATGNWQL